MVSLWGSGFAGQAPITLVKLVSGHCALVGTHLGV